MVKKRYVKTHPIKQAVDGRETEILDRVGVAWREGRPHIRCPYPEHEDTHPSWRWDKKLCRAFCTCLDQKSDSIFDVVMKVRGVDFEAAKMWIAEILGRQDLICESGNGTKQPATYQKTDAASLMNPSPEDRDAELPLRYLAHRLGIRGEELLPPSTPFVGHRHLAYFEAQAKGKPTVIGQYPCAVFQTVDAAGKRHAHRIYTGPDGAGKADLGLAPDGRARDVKKSARALDEESTAGRSVLWGNPELAPHILLAEGIETGQAVAQAFKKEVEAGEIAVAAAISAGGVEAFKPWPTTKRVTVAADRDENSKDDGSPGTCHGERAAREFCVRNQGRVSVGIALPGETGEKVDWLDIYRRAGVLAVRDGILAAQSFVPDEKEAQVLARQASPLAEVERCYPLPTMDLVHLEYLETDAGQVKVHKYVKSGKTMIPIPVCTPVGVAARLRYLDQNDAHGIRVVVQGMDGKPRNLDFERAQMAIAGGSEIRAALFAAGLRTEGDGEAVAVQMLKAACPTREILIVSRPGWHDLPGTRNKFYACPGGEIIGCDDQDVELSLNSRLREPVTAGTLEGWKAAVRAAVLVPGCPHFVIGTLAGFAGVTSSLCGMDTCGMNLSGLSSSGKSTAQRLAVSPWSTPAIGAGLFQSMRTTPNAIELQAQRSSGSILALDEMGHADGRDVAKMIYSIAGGVGKARMTASANLKEPYAWGTFVLLSGECSLEEKIRSEGGQWLAGMAVRICDIDITGINRSLDQKTLKAIAEVSHNYGHAGPAFVRFLVENDAHHAPDALRDRIHKVSRQIAGEKADSVRVRAALPFAILLVAGGLAQAAGLLPAETPIKEAIDWAWGKFQGSTDARALDPDQQAIENLQTWIAERWDVTIKSIYGDADSNDRPKMNNREACGWYDEDTVYIPTTRLREACGSTVKEIYLARVLDGRGLLARRRDSKHIPLSYVKNIGHVQCYALKVSVFGRVREAAA